MGQAKIVFFNLLMKAFKCARFFFLAVHKLLRGIQYLHFSHFGYLKKKGKQQEWG